MKKFALSMLAAMNVMLIAWIAGVEFDRNGEAGLTVFLAQFFGGMVWLFSGRENE